MPRSHSSPPEAASCAMIYSSFTHSTREWRKIPQQTQSTFRPGTCVRFIVAGTPKFVPQILQVAPPSWRPRKMFILCDTKRPMSFFYYCDAWQILELPLACSSPSTRQQTKKKSFLWQISFFIHILPDALWINMERMCVWWKVLLTFWFSLCDFFPFFFVTRTSDACQSVFGLIFQFSAQHVLVFWSEKFNLNFATNVDHLEWIVFLGLF